MIGAPGREPVPVPAPPSPHAPAPGGAPAPPARARPWARPELWALAGILLLAVAARFAGLGQGFPRDFHWDERIYFHETLYALANGLRREQTVSANLPYLMLPGVVLLGAVQYLAGQWHSFGDLVRAYIADPAPFLLLERGIWASAGVASVALVYRLGRRLAGPAIGLLGAFFLAGAFLHVEEGHFIKNDVPAGLFLLLALDACFSIQERGRRRDYLWAGLWIGVATATKYYCAGVAPIVLLAHLTRPAAERADTPGPGGRLGALARHPLVAAALAAIAGFVVTMPVTILDPANLWYNLDQELGARFGSIPTGDLPQWLFYLNEHLLPGLGWPLFMLGVAGLLVLVSRRTPKGILLAATPVLFFVAINLRPNNFARYAVPTVPFLCLAAAVALRAAVGTVLSPTLMRVRAYALAHPTPAVRALTASPRLRLLGPGLLVVGAVLAVVPSWANVVRYDRYALAPDARNEAQAWVEAHVPAGARVLIEGGESFERTSNLGPQLWPTAAQLEARGPNEPRERFFWEQLLAVVRQAPSYTLQLVGAFERTSQGGQRPAGGRSRAVGRRVQLARLHRADQLAQ